MLTKEFKETGTNFSGDREAERGYCVVFFLLLVLCFTVLAFLLPIYQHLSVQTVIYLFAWLCSYLRNFWNMLVARLLKNYH